MRRAGAEFWLNGSLSYRVQRPYLAFQLFCFKVGFFIDSEVSTFGLKFGNYPILLSSNRSGLTSSCDALNVTKAALLPEDSPQRRPPRWPPIKRRVPVAQGA